jgi:hypothetical protein
MNSKRVYFGMLGLIGLMVIGGVAAIVVGDNLLHKKANELVSLKLDNRVLDEQQVALISANKDIDKYAELENITKSIVPQDKDQAKTIREIVKIAEESGISIASLSFPSSNLGTAAPKPANVNSTDSGNKDTGNKQAAPAAPPVSQVKAVEGIPNVYQLEITLQSDTTNPVSFVNLTNFLTKLEQNRRTAQVAQINIQPKANDIHQLTFTLTINVFIKP